MLTSSKKRVLDFINSYTKKREVSPSLEDSRKGLRLKSVSTIHQHVKELEEHGYLRKESKRHRSIEISTRKDMVQVPLLGTIAAGQPIEAIEISDETITIAKDEIGKQGKHYALRVQGSSMIDEGIFDGDIVVIRKQDVAENGQTVVAVIDDNEATLKKLYRENGKFRLQPANPTLFPIYR